MSETSETDRPLILLVDDDLPLRRLMGAALSKSYAVALAENGEAALAAFHEHTPDLIILDVMMPRMDGWQTLTQIRAESDAPVIMLTAQDRAADVEKGFRLGANDFMTKPFAFQDLKARIEAVFQRTRERSSSGAAASRHLGLRLDDESGRAWLGRRQVELAPIEYRVLRRLMAERPRPVTRDALFRDAWGYSQESYGHLVDIVIERLRRKLETDPEHPEIIMTSWEGGYYLNDPGAA